MSAKAAAGSDADGHGTGANGTATAEPESATATTKAGVSSGVVQTARASMGRAQALIDRLGRPKWPADPDQRGSVVVRSVMDPSFQMAFANYHDAQEFADSLKGDFLIMTADAAADNPEPIVISDGDDAPPPEPRQSTRRTRPPLGQLDSTRASGSGAAHASTTDDEDDSYLGVVDDEGSHGYQPSEYVEFNASSEHSQQWVRDVPTRVFKNAFHRFEETVNDHRGWSEAKNIRRGKRGRIKSVYADKTVTMDFSDGESLDFPFEALVKPSESLDFPFEALVKPTKLAAPKLTLGSADGTADAGKARRARTRTRPNKFDPAAVGPQSLVSNLQQRKRPRSESASSASSASKSTSKSEASKLGELLPSTQVKMRQAFGPGKKICTREFAGKTLGVNPGVIDTMCSTGVAYRGWHVMLKSEAIPQTRAYPFLVDRQIHGGTLMHQVMFGSLDDDDEPEWLTRDAVRKLSGNILKELAIYETALVPESEEAELYEAECIMDENEKHYLVKWKGYSIEENTWEPKSTFGNVSLARTFEFQRGLAEVWDTIAETRAKTDIHEKITIVDRRKNAGNLLYLVKFVTNDDESMEPFWQNRTDLDFMVGDLDAFDAARDKEEALTGATMQESWEVERIVSERRRFYGRTAVMEYEVKWRGYPSEENTWETIDAILDETVVDKFHLHRDITKATAKMVKSMATIPQDPRVV